MISNLISPGIVSRDPGTVPGRARQVRIQGLVVSAVRPLLYSAILLPPQVCEMAQLVPGEFIQVQNYTTGRLFRARVEVGGRGAVLVDAEADPELRAGDALLLIAGERLPVPVPPPGTCTYCYAEHNQLVEIRDALSLANRASSTEPAPLPV